MEKDKTIRSRIPGTVSIIAGIAVIACGFILTSSAGGLEGQGWSSHGFGMVGHIFLDVIFLIAGIFLINYGSKVRKEEAKINKRKNFYYTKMTGVAFVTSFVLLRLVPKSSFLFSPVSWAADVIMVLALVSWPFIIYEDIKNQRINAPSKVFKSPTNSSKIFDQVVVAIVLLLWLGFIAYIFRNID